MAARIPGIFAARRILGRTVEGLQARVGVAHPYTLAATMVLATALAHQGRSTEAARLEQPVVSGREWVLGLQHPYTPALLGEPAADRASPGS